MALVSQKDAELIRGRFAKEMTDPVKIEYFTQNESLLEASDADCQYCKQTGELLSEVAALSPQIELTVRDDSTEAIPAIELNGKNRGRVRYLGIPAGYEFSSLIEDIVDVSNGVTKLSAATKAQLSELTRPVHIQVFVTPT